MHLSDSEFENLLARYRKLDAQELLELHPHDLTEVANRALTQAKNERMLTSEAKSEPREIISGSIPNNENLKGVGGWLALLIVSMCVGPVFGILRTLREFSDSEAKYSGAVDDPTYQFFKLLVWGTIGLASVLSLLGGIGLATSTNSKAVTTAKYVLWVANLGSSLIIFILLFLFFGPTMIDSSVLFELFRSIIPAVVWSSYLSSSKRVANTYRSDAGEMASKTS